MTLLEMNDAMLHPKHKRESVIEITEDDVNEFLRIVNINSNSKAAYDTIDDAGAYYSLFPDIKKIIGNKKCVEVFYASKCGYILKGVPCKLTYIISELFKHGSKEHINQTLNTAVSLLSTYAEYTYGDSNLSMKDIIENTVGSPISLLTEYKLKSKVNDSYWEVWIPDKKKVALIPDDIASMLSNDNIEELSYNSNIGIILQDVPLRTFNNRMGCTLNDFDLRDCF